MSARSLVWKAVFQRRRKPGRAASVPAASPGGPALLVIAYIPYASCRVPVTGAIAMGVMTMPGDSKLKVFREACHEAARRTPEVTFYELTEASGVPNFHSAAMSDSALRHRVLCRPRGGFVAYAAPPPFPGSALLHFREPPSWSEVFSWYGLRVLRAEVLATPLSSVDLSALDDQDQEALRRWRPRTLGELLFNWWGPRDSSAGRAARPGR